MEGEGTWSVERELGRGSFASVYLLVHTHPNARTAKDKCALKVIDEHGSREQDRQAALKELRIMRSLSHAHIVALIDSFETEQQLHLVLELCEGGDLRSFLDRFRKNGARIQKKPVGVEETLVLLWTQQLASALVYLHGKRILHRDLKPQNIFLKERYHLKIGDLGIARQLVFTQQMAITHIGTPLYMSPEIYQGVPYSYKADIWSMGCCVYEMMALEYAFSSFSRFELINKVVTKQVSSPPESYSLQLRTLTLSMLDKDPDKRPDASEVLTFVQIMHNEENSSLWKVKTLKESERTSKDPRPLKMWRQHIVNALAQFFKRKHTALSSHLDSFAQTLTLNSLVDTDADQETITITAESRTVKQREVTSSCDRDINEPYQLSEKNSNISKATVLNSNTGFLNSNIVGDSAVSHTQHSLLTSSCPSLDENTNDECTYSDESFCSNVSENDHNNELFWKTDHFSPVLDVSACVVSQEHSQASKQELKEGRPLPIPHQMFLQHHSPVKSGLFHQEENSTVGNSTLDNSVFENDSLTQRKNLCIKHNLNGNSSHKILTRQSLSQDSHLSLETCNEVSWTKEENPSRGDNQLQYNDLISNIALTKSMHVESNGLTLAKEVMQWAKANLVSMQTPDESQTLHASSSTQVEESAQFAKSQREEEIVDSEKHDQEKGRIIRRKKRNFLKEHKNKLCSGEAENNICLGLSKEQGDNKAQKPTVDTSVRLFTRGQRVAFKNVDISFDTAGTTD